MRKYPPAQKIAALLVALLFLVASSVKRSQAAPSLEDRARQALTQTSGKLHLAGLQQPVTVKRDRWGVAHIYAQNEHDLFFAQGVVAAQDRLFQMELWKRSGQGRLAEVLGPSALERDVNARLLRYGGDMQAEYESYAPDTREILAAFTAGINAYIASLTAAGGPGLPLEFQLAGFRPEPWKSEDCLNRMAAYSMTGNAGSELLNAALVARLGAEKASPLLDLDPAVMLDPAPGVNFSGLSPELLRNLVGSDSRTEFPPHSPVQESNNWTISGALTRTGAPFLANDPHRVIAEPSLRYMVHLVAPGWDVIGAGEPGLPGVALGHNRHIAWGFTIFGLDQQDLYLEELNPLDALQYKTEHGWAKMQVKHEKFAIKEGAVVQIDMKFTRHGPVLWDDGKRALALRWVGSEPGTAGYLASLSVDRAESWDAFEKAMARWKVPSENIVYADTEGNIGEHSTGLAPLRKNWTGLLPIPGAGGYEWSGFIANRELPHSFNPKAGFVATANHKMIPENYPYKIGYEWAPNYRITRITDVLSMARDKGHKLAIDDLEKLQTDVVSLPARELIGILRRSLGTAPDPTARMLLDWDGVLERNSGVAALYEIWLQELTSVVEEQVIPESVRALLDGWSLPKVISFLQQGDQGGADDATRKHVLQASLTKAREKLSSLQGTDPAQWSWGKLHAVRFRHPLDQVPGAAPVMDLGPLARPGDEYTVNATGFSGGSYEQTSGASYREIMDLSDWDKSVAVNTPGQSGQPGSPHYSDLLPLWDAGQYFPLAYSQPAVQSVTAETLVLEP
ncbi:MAG TPA: penicillin acylase family protein [Terriglobales bacterium]|nr:penicillin acylase family protein [Terriglobales bacterium]